MSEVETSVSAILLCFNGEAYVRDAIDGLLSQDYPGSLEILVSDDASSDRSFEIVSAAASRYAGPYTLRLFRNETNAGSKSAHLNRILPEASGDILISFDDDDISLPGRVSALVAAFSSEDVHAVYSSFSLIDEHGEPRGAGNVPHPAVGGDVRAWFARVDSYAPGATLAVRRAVVERFGPLLPDVHEDIALPFRASLLGKVVYLERPFVKARRRATSLTADLARFRSIEKYRERMRRGIEQARRNLESRLLDLERAEHLDPAGAAEWGRLRGIANASFAVAQSTERLLSPSFIVRVSALVDLIRQGAYREELAQHCFLALLPRTYLRYKRRSLHMGESDVTAAR